MAAMPDALLIASAVGLAFTANALRPSRNVYLSVPTFFAAWLTIELAPQLLGLLVAVTAILVANGALGEATGIIGLALTVPIAAGLTSLIVEARRVHHVMEASLQEALGDQYVTHITPPRAPGYDPKLPLRQLLRPFKLRHREVRRVRNLSYGPRGRRNRLDVYHHKDEPSGAPTLLYVHGGAWAVSNKNHQGKPLMLHLASRGWTCFTINYPLSPRAAWPEHIIDVKRAIAWVREHGHEYGADTSFIAITGGSAGGHLAALAALTANESEYQPGFEDADTSVQAAMPHYGVYDFTNDSGLKAAESRLLFLERVVLKARIMDAREEFLKASPVHRVHDEAPPFFVVHGTFDSLAAVEEARDFVGKLRAVSKQPVAYAELPGAHHAFDVFHSIRSAHAVRGIERFADWCWTRHNERRAAPEAPQAQR